MPMSPPESPLDPATAGELRRLVGEVVAEVLPGLSRAPRPAVGPASALTAGGIPSGVPAGGPASAPACRRPQRGNVDGNSVLFDDGAEGTPGGRAAGIVQVRVDSDADLRDFALRVLRLADNAKLRRDLIAGRIRFRLAGEPAPAAARAAHRVDKGAVTERAVAAAAAAGARLVLGPRAVLTPLAKDKARALGVPIEKER